jgi:hypothetical protein
VNSTHGRANREGLIVNHGQKLVAIFLKCLVPACDG